MSKAATLILGISIGVFGTILYRRLEQVVKEEDPSKLLDRVSDQLEALERKAKGITENAEVA